MFLKDLPEAIRRRYLHQQEQPFAGQLLTAPRQAFILPPEPKILFLRQDRLGDVLVSVPLFRAIRKHNPRARLHVLLGKRNYPARRAILPWVNRVWRYDRLPHSAGWLLAGLRYQKYDVVVDLLDRPSATSSFAARWIGRRYRLGFYKENASVYTHCVPLDRSREHIVERIARFMLPFGIEPTEESLDLEYRVSEADVAAARARLRPTDKPVRLGINISASNRQKEWGEDNIVGFVRWVQQRYCGLDVTVCGAPADASQVARITTATGVGGAPPLPSFHDFAAVVHEFDVLLTPDTSTLHLAAAWKIPTVALFHWWEQGFMPWYPYRSPYRALGDRHSVANIPLAAVQDAFESLMGERLPALGGPTRALQVAP